MIYRNGKKIGAIFRNGQSIGKIFRNGQLVWQKDNPALKRIKSIAVSIPAWGTVGRVEWESILRAVSPDVRNSYLDCIVKGVAMRLRGNGGTYKAGMEIISSLTGSAKLVITLPENVDISSDLIAVGQELSFVAKIPAVTHTPTYVYSNNSYTTSAFYQFEGAPFLSGSTFAVKVTARGSSSYELNADLTGAFTTSSPAVRSTGTASYLATVSKEYKDAEFEKMAKYSTSTYKKLLPSFYLSVSGAYSIKQEATLTTPACTLSRKYKILTIETD